MTKDTDHKTGRSKICAKCKLLKPLEQFWNDKSAKDGKVSRCIECGKEDKRIRRGPPSGIRSGWRKWSEEDIMRVALTFSTRIDFETENNAIYTAARRHPFGLEHFCAHMAPINESWTFEKLLARAKGYESIKEFRLHDPAAYCAGLRSGRKDELYAHMTDKLVHTDRYVYLIQSTDRKTAYVGLSQNPKRRYREHKRSGTKPVRDLIACEHTFNIIAGPVSEEEAQLLEDRTLRSMREEGICMLNSQKAGSIGSLGAVKWTYETIAKEALKYNKIVDFERGSSGAYHAAIRRFGGAAQFCGHMKKLRYWDEESITEEALKYKMRGEFWHAGGSAANAAKRLGIIDKVCAHMSSKKTSTAAHEYKEAA